jgi:hydroxymethylglutaryl-CoA reductase
VALKILSVSSAPELAEVIAAVGLAQNLAALRALSAEGIQHGHMALHARQMVMAAGAKGDEIEIVTERLVAEQRLRPDQAEKALRELRAETLQESGIGQPE